MDVRPSVQYKPNLSAIKLDIAVFMALAFLGYMRQHVDYVQLSAER